MRIALVGDVMLGRLVNDRLRRVGPAYPWGDVLPLLERASLRFANLECVIADDGPPWPRKTFHFRSDTKNVDVLRVARIDVVSLANNHTLDHGVPALREMLPVLDRHGILHAGAGLDAEAARRPAVCTRDGTAVGFIAFTDNEPGWAAGPGSPGVLHVPVDLGEARAQELLELIRQTRLRTGFLVVSAHWGSNWGSEVPEEHRAFAHALVDAGADAVFGHSAHIFRGVEVYRGRPLVYSAGDFIDDYAVDPEERNDQSFLFLLEVQDGLPRSLRLHPTVIADFRAGLATADARSIAARMQELSAELGTSFSWLDEERFLVLPLA
ncbi:capsule biosynthesis protein [Kocuria dechangensis]|uniref:Capsule biosynthesis protein n=1 Tax=Kocuria dechangensis TaxID=1176249 RepID=A0A917LRT5_9MICC|nr:CapA family protein [Kocuria dechangensis]GGG53302.1 capsule biosynthesis protein [Kocuria dechangensis]